VQRQPYARRGTRNQHRTASHRLNTAVPRATDIRRFISLN